MIRRRDASADVRHEWARKHEAGRGVYECRHCQMWTANVRRYLVEVCEARDRRKVTRRHDD